MIMDYNMNDVLITKRLYEEIEPLRRLRDELGHIYNTNLSSASNSRVANIILEKIYAEELKANMADILCFTGHKSLFGPQGTGGIITNSELKLKKIIKTAY